MGSDLRVLEEPLAWRQCEACGLGWRTPHRDPHEFFSDGYELYIMLEGDRRTHGRQALYASWIATQVGIEPDQVLDVGCANGSLLKALRVWWPTAVLHGCDPSAEAVEVGTGDGVQLWTGTTADVPPDLIADLVVSVNVIEHTPDPVEFLAEMRRRLADDGRVVLVCPDGTQPWVELLFADHLYSFLPAHLDVLFRRAGLEILSTSKAPSALGPFQMVIARAGDPEPRDPEWGPAPLRDAYLERWSRLDAELCARLDPEVVCFGAGEAAGLLRSYAPQTWDRVVACTYDGATGGSFGDRPIVGLGTVDRNASLLIGVSPANQSALMHRLARRFPRAVMWHDLVDGR